MQNSTDFLPTAIYKGQLYSGTSLMRFSNALQIHFLNMFITFKSNKWA